MFSSQVSEEATSACPSIEVPEVTFVYFIVFNFLSCENLCLFQRSQEIKQQVQCQSVSKFYCWYWNFRTLCFLFRLYKDETVKATFWRKGDFDIFQCAFQALWCRPTQISEFKIFDEWRLEAQKNKENNKEQNNFVSNFVSPEKLSNGAYTVSSL